MINGKKDGFNEYIGLEVRLIGKMNPISLETIIRASRRKKGATYVRLGKERMKLTINPKIINEKTLLFLETSLTSRS